MDEQMLEQMQQAQAQQGAEPQGEATPQEPQGESGIANPEAQLESFGKETLIEMEKELQETQTSLDANYAKEFVKEMTAEEQELMASDPEKFLRAYEQRKAADLEKKLKPKLEKVNVMREKLAKIEKGKANAELAKEFAAKHKGTSASKVVEYFDNELSKRQQEEFAKKWKSNQTPPLQQLEEILQLMQKGKKQEQDLPFDVSGEKYATNVQDTEHVSAFLRP